MVLILLRTEIDRDILCTCQARAESVNKGTVNYLWMELLKNISKFGYSLDQGINSTQIVQILMALMTWRPFYQEELKWWI